MLRAWGENEVTQPSALASQSFTRARSCLAPPWQSMVEEGVIEKFIGLDMSDAETVFDRCLEAIQRVKKVCGAVGGGEDACVDMGGHAGLKLRYSKVHCWAGGGLNELVSERGRAG